MPNYDYRTAAGLIVQRCVPIAERDLQPGLTRLEVPTRIRADFRNTDPTNPEKAIPQALKNLEHTVPADRIARDSGYSVRELKRVWQICVVLVCTLAFSLQPSAFSADITAGYSFASDDIVTSINLNQVVGSAVINPSFISGQTAGTPSTSANLLFESGGNLRRVTAGNFWGNTNVITIQSEDSTPATNDLVLTYDTSANALKKVQLGKLMSRLDVPSTLGAPNTNNYIFTANFGFTSEYDSVLSVGGYPFTSGPSNLAAKGTFTINAAHGLPGTPQHVRGVLVCTSTDNGYAVGDEIDVRTLSLQAADGNSPFILVANATNVYLHGLGAYAIANRGTFVYGNLDTNKWQAKIYARYTYY